MKKVLVADDTKNIRTLLTSCLEIEGYTVKTANDGRQALELFKREKFDLAFLDIKMPEISGTEVLKKIRQIGIETPVIIITAFATVKNAVECTQMGAVAYLQKPFTADKVKSVLNMHCNVQGLEFNDSNIEDSIKQIENALDQGLFATAIGMLKKAISAEPANPYIYLLFSKAYQGMGNKEYAEKFNAIYTLLNAK